MSTQELIIIPEQLLATQLRGEYPALLDMPTAAAYLAGHIPCTQLIPIGDLIKNAVANRPMNGLELNDALLRHIPVTASRAGTLRAA
ncbi:MAG: hypothetical protein WBO57_03420 [Gammaproteobacteria bacterium]